VKHRSDVDPAIPYAGSQRGDADRPEARRARQRIFPLSIQTSLVIVVLIPLMIAAGLASTFVLHQTSARRQAVTARQSSLVLDSLLRARVDVYAEYVPSAALLAVTTYHISIEQIDALLGVNFQANLVGARKAIDQLPIFRPTGALATDYAELVTLRQAIDQGRATPDEVESFFNRLGSTIDTRWRNTFATLVDDSESSASVTTRHRLSALGSSFDAFTSGLGEESLQGGGSLETMLTSASTPSEVEGLIVAHQQFESSVRGFPEALGPKARVAWAGLNRNPLTKSFSNDVELAMTAGLGHGAPPYATDSGAIGEIGRSEVEWDTSLTNVVLASSADLRVATVDQANSATRALYLTFLFMLLLILAAIGAVVILGREVRGPLARIVAAASSVREGELDFPELDESGPRELSLAAQAINEMSSTLRAVQGQAIALSEGDLDNPALKRSLPGRTGAALQAALTELHQSVQTAESQREVLTEKATRDSLTGLLNRGAALEALELHLANVHRSQGHLELTVLFIDLDDLKSINDSLGHDGGDAAIQTVADALRVTTRASDVLARFGGDEFVVGWLGTSGSDAPALLAKRISAHVANSELEGNGHLLTLACSIGAAVSEPDDDSVETLIGRADQALYVAKTDGRGQVRWFGSERLDPSDAGRSPSQHRPLR
jgi:diguanylate cyclase (GGDEF)-like protein